MIDEPPPLDVIGGGSEEDPWRPSRRQWQALSAGAVALALAAGGTAFAQHRREQVRLDRAAVADVRLALATALNHADVQDGYPLLLRQDGHGAVRVRSVRVDLAGFREQRLDQSLQGDGIGLLVPVRDTASCGDGLLRSTPPDVVVTLQTARGTRLVRRVRGGPDTEGLLVAAQDRCGWLPPDRAVQAAVESVEAHGTSALVTLSVLNRSVLPMSLAGLDAGPGTTLTAVPGLPLALPGSSDPSTQDARLELQVRVTVTDCRALQEAVAARDDGDLHEHLTARVTSRFGAASVDLGGLGLLQPVTADGFEFGLGPDPLLDACSPPGGLVR